MINFCAPNRIEVGKGSISRLGELIASLGGAKALVVLDAFLVDPAVGLCDKIENICKNAGILTTVYGEITSEPTSSDVADGLEIAKSAGCDCVVAIGGGSVIDVAKAISVLAANLGLAFLDIPKQPRLKRLPLIAVPTTAGTGSEATKVSVITNASTGVKENPGHWAMVPDIAVLDAELMLTLPPKLTAFTGMDALTHAMEAYISTKANPLSDLYALEAMKIVSKALIDAVENGSNLIVREQMALASLYAGIAFSNASTNLAHAGGRALGAYFHVPHGLSVALFLPFVMEFGLEAAQSRYAQVAIALGADPAASEKELSHQAVAIVNTYNDRFGVWQGIKTYVADSDIYRRAIPEMAKNAVSGNGILTNPVVPNEADVAKVFEQLASKAF